MIEKAVGGSWKRTISEKSASCRTRASFTRELTIDVRIKKPLRALANDFDDEAVGEDSKGGDDWSPRTISDGVVPEPSSAVDN